MNDYKYKNLCILQKYFILELSFEILDYIQSVVYTCITKKDVTYSTYREYVNVFSTLEKCIDHCVHYSLTYETSDEFLNFYNYLKDSDFNVSVGLELYTTGLNKLSKNYSRYDAEVSISIITDRLESTAIGYNKLDVAYCEDYYNIVLGLNSEAEEDSGIYRNGSKYTEISNVKILNNLRLVLYDFNLYINSI